MFIVSKAAVYPNLLTLITCILLPGGRYFKQMPICCMSLGKSKTVTGSKKVFGWFVEPTEQLIGLRKKGKRIGA
jgi:hypothetical protein